MRHSTLSLWLKKFSIFCAWNRLARSTLQIV
jgi:hypothetical protein